MARREKESGAEARNGRICNLNENEKVKLSGFVSDQTAGGGTSILLSRRARFMGASAIAGGVLRSLAVAAGMVTVFGSSPASAQCFSGAVPPGTLLGLECQITAAPAAAPPRSA
jgi:hypothetical protein